jgi:uncharacterized protein YjbI with pentapeptide repeats
LYDNCQQKIVTTTSDSHAAQEFLKSSIDRRMLRLQEIGLLRYAKLLTQIEPIEGNIACVERFLSYPSRMKFPLLMGVDLTGLQLDGVNFIRANLTAANLTGCCLQDADLMFGNFSRANLRDANLRGATLNETIWMDAIVSGCDFRGAIGLTLIQVCELRSRGGIFE